MMGVQARNPLKEAILGVVKAAAPAGHRLVAPWPRETMERERALMAVLNPTGEMNR